LVNTYGGLTTSGTGGNNGVTVDIAIGIDGTVPSNGSIQAVAALTYASIHGYGNWSINQPYSLSAGSHTFTIYGRLVNNNSSTAVVSGASGADTQGVLTVSFLKQ
jgi:hypothetical protein